MLPSLRVVMAQLRVVGGDIAGNLAGAARMIADAATLGGQVVVLPECLDVGWTHPDTPRLASPIPGPVTQALGAAADRAGIWVVAGLAEREGAQVYNSAVLLDPGGRVVLRHRKIHELALARHLYQVGDSLAVARTSLGTIGLAICADLFPSHVALGHALARMGAGVILSPCAWAVPATHDQTRQPYGALWLESYGALARESNVGVVGVSSVGPLEAGPWAGRRCIGCSLAMGPGGTVLDRAPYGEQAECLRVVDIPWPQAGREPDEP